MRQSPANAAARPIAVTIPAAVSPAEANTLRDRLLAALSAAEANGLTIEAEIDGTPVLPCAQQLLVSLEKTAAARGTPLSLGPGARVARLSPAPSATKE